jgi:hypothetical protein
MLTFNYGLMIGVEVIKVLSHFGYGKTIGKLLNFFLEIE